MKLKLGFSPCPNDTFIFYALVNQKIDKFGLDFEYEIHDVEVLNRMALSKAIDVTKLSYFTYSKLINDYIMLSSGGALGSNCGPLLVSRYKDYAINGLTSVAIPGINTTANLLLTLAYPQILNKTELLFSEIEQAVLDGQYEAGLIIHESRFTYESKGLYKISDLGEFWETTTQSPIPLGGIAMQKQYDDEVKQLVNTIIRNSVHYAFDHVNEAMPFIKSYSQELQEEVILKHIALYVNDFTKDLGHEGRKGVSKFFQTLEKYNLISIVNQRSLVFPPL